MTQKTLRMKIKTQRRLRNVLISLMVICLTPLCEEGRRLKGASSENTLAGREIVCAIALCDDMYGGHGLETGLSYNMINRFAHDNRCSVKIIAAGKGENWLDSLKQDKADIVVMHTHGEESHEGIHLSRSFDDHTAWAVKDASKLKTINMWISHMTSSHEFEKIRSIYARTYDPIRRAEKGIVSDKLSPYDDIIRKYANELGWDWRMLAAVVYQESKFSINSRSHRGAQGLMQVMPQTARHYDIHDLLDPDQNLRAGTSHLKRLQNLYIKQNLEHIELIKFTLAAYNAGEGRVADCRNFAAKQQVDSTRWDEIVKIIPLMREDSILEDDSVKLGKFQGHETIAYIDNVMELYNAFCKICPEC